MYRPSCETCDVPAGKKRTKYFIRFTIILLYFVLCTAIDGHWSAWSSWSPCGPDCRHHRTRTCTAPSPSNGGRYCAGRDTVSGNCSGGSCIGKYDYFLHYFFFFHGQLSCSQNGRTANSKLSESIKAFFLFFVFSRGPHHRPIFRRRLFEIYNSTVCPPRYPYVRRKTKTGEHTKRFHSCYNISI